GGERARGVAEAQRHGGLDAQAVRELAPCAELLRVLDRRGERVALGLQALATASRRLVRIGQGLAVLALVGGIECEVRAIARVQRVRCRALDDRIGAPEQTCGFVETV